MLFRVVKLVYVLLLNLEGVEKHRHVEFPKVNIYISSVRIGLVFKRDKESN